MHRLKINRYEFSQIRFLWGLRFLYQVGFIWAWTVLTSAFLNIFGIDKILYLLLADAWLLLVGSYMARWLFIRIKPNTFLLSMIMGTIICVFIGLLFKSHMLLFFGFLILAKDFFYAQFNIGLDRKIEGQFSPTQAQKAMPILDSAVTIGTISSAFIFLLLLDFFEITNIIFFWFIPLFSLLFLVFNNNKILKEIPVLLKQEEEKQSLDEVKSLIRRTPFLYYLCIFVFVQMSLYTVIEFEFLKYVKEKSVHEKIHFSSEMFQANVMHRIGEFAKDEFVEVKEEITNKYFVQTGIATELGVLAFIFGFFSLIVQLSLASRILQRIGVVYSMMVFFGGLLSMILFVFMGGGNMKFVRGYQHSLEALLDSAYHITFYSVFPYCRDSVRHFVEGFVKPGGMIFGIGLMVGLNSFFPNLEASILMISLVCLLILILIPLRGYYTHLSRENLSRHHNITSKIHDLEVLSQKGHHSVINSLLQELVNPEVHQIVKEKIIHILSHMNNPKAVHTYIKILTSSEESEVLKIKILESLLHISSLRKYWKKHVFSQHHLLKILKGIFDVTSNNYMKKLIVMNIFKHLSPDKVVPFFTDLIKVEDDDIKSVCLRSAGEVFTDPELIYYIGEYLSHKNSKVQGGAILALWNIEDRKILEETIDGLLVSSRKEDVISGIYVLGEVKCRRKESLLFEYSKHACSEIQIQSLVALAKLGNKNCIKPIIDILFGDDELTANRLFQMLYRAPEFLEYLKREIEMEVSIRVIRILDKEKVYKSKHLSRLSLSVRGHLKRLYRLADRYDEIILLETC